MDSSLAGRHCLFRRLQTGSGHSYHSKAVFVAEVRCGKIMPFGCTCDLRLEICPSIEQPLCRSSSTLFQIDEIQHAILVNRYFVWL